MEDQSEVSGFFSLQLGVHEQWTDLKEMSPPAVEAHADQGLIPGLTNDLALMCLARIPFAHQATAKAVCLAWSNAFRNGDVYHVRRRECLLEKLLCMCVNSRHMPDELGGATVLPIKVYDPQGQHWLCLPPLKLWGGPGQLMEFKCVTSGHELFILAGERALPAGGGWPGYPSSPIWCFNGQKGEWEQVESEGYARKPCAVAGVLDGRLFVAGMEVVDSDNENDTILWRTTLEQVDLRRRPCVWNQVTSRSPLLPLWYWINGALVKDGQLYIIARMDLHGGFIAAIFDPSREVWEVDPDFCSDEYSMAGECPFAVVKGQVYGVCWVVAGHERTGATIIRFREDKRSWETVVAVPAGEGSVKVVGYYLSAIDSKLFVVETGYHESGMRSYVVNSLYVLDLSRRDGDRSWRWEIVNVPIESGSRSQEKVLACSAIEV